VPVLYLGGCQRSGSTLLDRMLSQVSGYASAGEVVHLWTRGVREDELCGCGERFHACPFWSEVGRVAFGGWDRLPVENTIALQRRVDRNRYIFFMMFPTLAPRAYRRDLRAYAGLLGRLYAAIRSCGGGVVVDSSKHPSTAFLLRRVDGVRLRVVHLVRDSRGVAFSLGKTVRRPEVLERETFMHRQSAWRAAIDWVAFNGMFHILRRSGTDVTRIRYEDLIASPRAAIGRVVGPTEPHGGHGLDFIDGSRVTLGPDHTVAGNPMRFAHGPVDLRVDDAWRASMRSGARRLTTAVTAPLLAAYGYRLWRP
jgi:hypothetical protein